MKLSKLSTSNPSYWLRLIEMTSSLALNFLSGFSCFNFSTSFSLFTIIGLNCLFSKGSKTDFNALKMTLISSALKDEHDVFLLISVFAIISSAYRLPRPFVARILTISSSSPAATISLNSSIVNVIGLIPFSIGKTYSFLELMSLSLQCFLLRGNMISLDSFKRIMFPCEKSSTIRV